jgi:nitrite reductase (NO-forming)
VSVVLSEFVIEPEQESVDSGEVTFALVKPGESQTADFGVIDAEAQAWCTVPGHKEAGMVLTIAVASAPAGPP